MCRRHPNVHVRGPPDPVLVHYSVSGDGIDQVTYVVCLHGRCLKDTIFGVWTSTEFVRFICSLEFDSSTILGQILSRLPSSIREGAVFFSLVKDCWTTVSSLSSSPTSLPDPVLFHYSVSGDWINQVTYVACLHGRCLKDTIFGVWTSTEFVRFIRSLEFDSSTILGQILSRLPSSIRKGDVFLSSVKDRWTAVSSLSSSPTSLWTLRASSLLQISLFTNGVPILPWLGLLYPITLVARTSLSLVRKSSVKGAITSVWD